MTAEERRDEEVKRDHPNLWNDVHSGNLPEYSGEFITAATEYPIKRKETVQK